ncbi:MAG: AAA family ATPase, partial [Armatimonadetes bacterium]|nr:AAA family ATPase [Armatimonadota bacterium]
VLDSERNHARKEFSSIFSFRPEEVWEGKLPYCEGLVRDWASWQRDNGDAFRLLESVLQTLSPSPEEPLTSGRLRRISVDDSKDYPTIKMPYNQEVAVIHASAGLRRIIALAYLLVWTWREHLLACELRRTAPTKDIVFLFDEVEAHLHPQWQRRILPALFAVMAKLTGEHAVNVQMIAATHSPLALASLETFFDSEQDAWFDIDLVRDKRKVAIERRDFIRKGTAGRWLTSEAFDLLSEGRSLEGEQAIAKAEALLDRRNNGATLTKEEIESVDAGLRQTLPDIDRFWVRWRSFVDEGEWLQ